MQSLFYYVKHLYFGLSLEDLHHKVFQKSLRGISLRDLSFQAASFVEKEGTHLLYFPTLQRLRRAQHEGHYTMILSSSPAFLVEVIASFLSVDDFKASEYAVDKDQRLCKISSILLGDGKASWVHKVSLDLGIARDNIIAYSDSHLDLPFLLSAGTAIVVSPDAKLKKVSVEKGWEEI